MSRARPSSWLGAWLVPWLGAALLSVSAPAGCGTGDLSPEETARGFIAAVRARNTESVLSRLDQPTKDHLARMAEVATDRVGGRRVLEPVELLQVVSIDPSFDVESTALLEQSETHARVELTSPAGAKQIISLVREQEGWRVELPALRSPEAAAQPTGA